MCEAQNKILTFSVRHCCPRSAILPMQRHRPALSAALISFGPQAGRRPQQLTSLRAAAFSSQMPTIPNVQHLKRFYKHARVIQHPDSDSFDKLSASEEVTMDNMSKSHGPYWAVALDSRVVKTLYKDPMPIPSRALAVALAEEWEA